MFYEVENEGNLIAGVVGYDSIRKHLAECDYHTAEIREKDHPIWVCKWKNEILGGSTNR